VCRSDEILYAGYCTSVLSSAAQVTTAPSLCLNTRYSFSSPPYLNSDYLALTVLSAFLYKESTIAPNSDTVSTKKLLLSSVYFLTHFVIFENYSKAQNNDFYVLFSYSLE